MAHIARGEFDDAYRIIRSANPLPSVCARVAVIGAGPAGLAAAHSLSVIGHRVTVFEKEAVPGGMLVCAIPAYRLPREPLQEEIRRLMSPNLEVKYNKALGRDFTIEGLLKDGYKAVYLALGSHQSKKLDVPGEDVEDVIQGIRFLKAYNLENKELAHGNVGIVGGGNSAIDAARVAWRQPGVKSVTVFYRRSRTEMPAYVEEIEAALAEGIKVEELVAPVEVLSENGVLSGARFIRNRLAEPDASGRRKPVPIPGTEFTAALDTLIVAISEQPDPDGLSGVEMTRWGTVAVNPESGLTNYPGVFAGGDVATGPNTVIAALAAGKNAALTIDRYVSGKLLKKFRKVKLPTVYIEPPFMAEEEGSAAARVVSAHIPVPDRRHSFAEVELCISSDAAVCEARRCLRCDLEFTQPVEQGA